MILWIWNHRWSWNGTIVTKQTT